MDTIEIDVPAVRVGRQVKMDRWIFRALVIAAFEDGRVSSHYAAMCLFNAGFRGRGLDLRQKPVLPSAERPTIGQSAHNQETMMNDPKPFPKNPSDDMPDGQPVPGGIPTEEVEEAGRDTDKNSDSGEGESE